MRRDDLQAAEDRSTAHLSRDTGAVPAAGRHSRSRPRPRWPGLAAVIAAAVIGCAIAVTLVEGASGKPLSAMVQGKPGHGTTLGGGAVGKGRPAKPSPTPSTSTAGAAVTAPASSTTTAGTSSSPAARTAPAATAPSGTPASSTSASSVPNSTTPSATAGG